jgi:hypothetical protein
MRLGGGPSWTPAYSEMVHITIGKSDQFRTRFPDSRKLNHRVLTALRYSSVSAVRVDRLVVSLRIRDADKCSKSVMQFARLWLVYGRDCALGEPANPPFSGETAPN